jgi:hypothetical protein
MLAGRVGLAIAAMLARSGPPTIARFLETGPPNMDAALSPASIVLATKQQVSCALGDESGRPFFVLPSELNTAAKTPTAEIASFDAQP